LPGQRGRRQEGAPAASPVVRSAARRPIRLVDRRLIAPINHHQRPPPSSPATQSGAGCPGSPCLTFRDALTNGSIARILLATPIFLSRPTDAFADYVASPYPLTRDVTIASPPPGATAAGAAAAGDGWQAIDFGFGVDRVRLEEGVVVTFERVRLEDTR
jgi:hypothetical protein